MVRQTRRWCCRWRGLRGRSSSAGGGRGILPGSATDGVERASEATAATRSLCVSLFGTLISETGEKKGFGITYSQGPGRVPGRPSATPMSTPGYGAIATPGYGGPEKTPALCPPLDTRANAEKPRGHTEILARIGAGSGKRGPMHTPGYRSRSTIARPRRCPTSANHICGRAARDPGVGGGDLLCGQGEFLGPPVLLLKWGTFGNTPD